MLETAFLDERLSRLRHEFQVFPYVGPYVCNSRPGRACEM